jgi:hypothetical protein
MNSSISKILKVVALLIVIYFLGIAISAIDVAPSKYQLLTFQKKAALDKLTELDAVKYKAIEYIDDIARIHENAASEAILNMNLLIILLCIQIYLGYAQKRTT